MTSDADERAPIEVANVHIEPGPPRPRTTAAQDVAQYVKRDFFGRIRPWFIAHGDRLIRNLIIVIVVSIVKVVVVGAIIVVLFFYALSGFNHTGG